MERYRAQESAERGPRCSCGAQSVRRRPAEKHQPKCARRLWLEREEARQQLKGAVEALEDAAEYLRLAATWTADTDRHDKLRRAEERARAALGGR
jgi:hypothetical protein